MELLISDEKMKSLIKEVLIEILIEKKEVFYEVILDAIEETGLANAIKQDRKNKFVNEDKILKIIRFLHRKDIYRFFP